MKKREALFKFYETAARIENGLVLLDAPTGYGKTYEMIRCIKRLLAEEKAAGKTPDAMRRIYLTTVLLKNLPRVEQFGEYAKYVLRIDSADKSVTDSIGEAIAALYGDVSPAAVWEILVGKKHVHALRALYLETEEEFTRLVMCVKEYRSRLAYDRLGAERFLADDLLRVMKGYEKALSQSLKRLNPCDALVDPLAFAREVDKGDSPLHWLGKMYPGVLLPVRPVVILSIKKMLWGVKRLIAPLFQFFEEGNAAIDGALFFIDEFDSTKRDMLDMLIDMQVKPRDEDTITLVDAIATIAAKGYEAVPKSYKWYQTSKLRKSAKEISENASSILKEHNLHKGNCIFPLSLNSDSALFFRDFTSTVLLTPPQGGADDSAYQLSIAYDEEDGINRITVAKEPPDKSHSVTYLLTGLSSIEDVFAMNVYKTGYFYAKHSLSQERPITIEEGISTVMDNLGLDKFEGFFDNVTKISLSVCRLWGTDSLQREFPPERRVIHETCLYGTGYTLMTFKNSPRHNDRTKIVTRSFKIFPENLMLNLAARGCVIGISATAAYPSVKNYDLEYLETMLGVDYHSPENRDDRLRKLYAAISEEYAQSTAGYDKVNINAEFIDACSSETTWAKIAEGLDKGTAEMLRMHVEAQCGGDRYLYGRYLKFALVYKRFRDEKIQSLLYCSNAFPCWGEEIGKFSLNVLEKIAQVLDPSMECLRVVRTANFDDEIKKIKAELETGRRRFVITTYNTMGSGVNIQYRIPAGWGKPDIVQVGQFEDEYKDFDAIYLEKPTYTLPKLEMWDDPEKGLAHWNCVIKYSYQNHELSESNKERLLKCGYYNYLRSITDSESVKRQMVRRIRNLCKQIGKWQQSGKSLSIANQAILKQAIGRISRTQNKNINTFIFVDGAINAAIFQHIDPKLRTREFEAFRRLVRARGEQANSVCEMESKYADLFTYRAEVTGKNKKIAAWSRRIRRGWSWTKEKMEEWKSLRFLALRLPTANDEDCGGITGKLIRNFYVMFPSNLVSEAGPQPCIWWKKGADMEYLRRDEVFPVPDKEYSGGWTAESLGLKAVLQNGFVRKRFIEKGFATDIIPRKYVMTPYMALFIYRAALGEEAGRAVLESYRFGGRSVELEDMPAEHFEDFDARVKSLPHVCVDFKYWRRDNYGLDEIRAKLEEKAKEGLGCRYVMYVNIYARQDGGCYKQEIKVGKQRITVAVIPSLLDPYDPSTLNREAEALIAALLEEAAACPEGKEHENNENLDS